MIIYGYSIEQNERNEIIIDQDNMDDTHDRIILSIEQLPFLIENLQDIIEQKDGE
jgi:hypothetical protein